MRLHAPQSAYGGRPHNDSEPFIWTATAADILA